MSEEHTDNLKKVSLWKLPLRSAHDHPNQRR
jgi:hypothetical protein